MEKMISQELEVTLHMAFVDARQQRHEFITVEHLLLALIDNPSASDILKACAVDNETLKKSLINHTENAPMGIADEVETQPTLVSKSNSKAIMHVQSTSNGRGTGANVLSNFWREGFSRGLLSSSARRKSLRYSKFYCPWHF